MSPSYAHIGCCIDDSPAGARALDTAVGLWRASQGTLSLVHVGPFPLEVETIDCVSVFRRTDLNARARAWLRRRARDVPQAVPVFLQGVRGPAVCAWAEGAGADLLVVGSGSGRMAGMRPGGFVHHLVGHAPCPVLVVRPPAPSAASDEARPLAVHAPV